MVNEEKQTGGIYCDPERISAMWAGIPISMCFIKAEGRKPTESGLGDSQVDLRLQTQHFNKVLHEVKQASYTE